MTDREAMKMALEALEASIDVPCYGGHPKQEAAAAALRAQLEQPEQEPVAYKAVSKITGAVQYYAALPSYIDPVSWDILPLFDQPQPQPQPQRKPLTKAELEAMAEKHVTNCYFDTLTYAREIEAVLGIR